MKQEFEMSEEELQAIYDISINKMPMMLIGNCITGCDSQEQANSLWKLMGDKYGFVWDSAEGSARGKRFFLATPKTIVKPKTIEELAIEKYVNGGIKEIIKQLEFCNYESQGGPLINNVAFLALKELSK